MHRSILHARALLVPVLMMLALAGCDGETGERAKPGADGSAVVDDAGERAEMAVEGSADGDGNPTRTETAGALPRLVDLGKGTCIPCKMMAPILEELGREYQGRAVVEVIDLREDGQAASKYGIRVIPTQIFFDSEGKEVWRHEGFLPKDQIVAKFTEMGVPPLDN